MRSTAAFRIPPAVRMGTAPENDTFRTVRPLRLRTALSSPTKARCRAKSINQPARLLVQLVRSLVFSDYGIAPENLERFSRADVRYLLSDRPTQNANEE